jgi:membrane-bound lytic murein transglycosylase D
LPPIHLATVEAPPATALTSVARAIGEDPAVIEELNAHLIRKRTPPGKRTALRIPKQKLALFQQSAGRLGGDGGGEGSQHSVRYGETLAEIAQRYGTTEAALRKLNELDDTAELERDTVLLVPTTRSKTDAAPRPRPRAAVPLVTPDQGSRLVFFEVTRATSPRGLGEAFGVAWDSIVAWNDLDPQARLQPGQILQIIVPRNFNAETARVDLYEADQVDRVVRGSREHIEGMLRDRGLVRRGYRVRKGEDLTKIGKKFDLSDGDLGRINAFSRDHIPEPGSTIVVYVAKGKERGTVDAPPPVRAEAEAAAEPVPEAEHPRSPADMDAEPGPAHAPVEIDAGASTETTTKVPGQQGWTRKPSTLGKTDGKSDSKPKKKAKKSGGAP